jgi:hypothetical protein
VKFGRYAFAALFVATTAVALAAGPAGNSNGSTNVGNGSAQGAYIAASASPGQLLCVGPTSGPNNVLVATPCATTASSGVTAVTGTGNINVTAGATPVVSITNAPVFTGNVAANCFNLGTATGPSLCTGTSVPTASATPGSFFADSAASGSTAPGYLYASLPVTFGSVAAADGAAHSYDLNDTNTTAIDKIAGTNGTYSGTYTQGQTALSSDVSASTYFNNGQITLPFTDVNGTGSYSIEGLINVTSYTGCTASNICTFVSNVPYADQEVDGFWAGIYNTGTPQFIVETGGSLVFGGPTIATGTTYDFLFTYNAATTTTTLYVNGQSVGSLIGAYTPGVNGIVLANINQTPTPPGSEILNGREQSVSFYTYALSATQAANHYQALVGSGWLPITTNIGAVYPITASTVGGSTSISCVAPACFPTYSITGTAVANTFHQVLGTTSCSTTISGTCGATVTFTGSAVFSSATSYSCSDTLTGGGMTTPLTYITVTPTAGNTTTFAVYNGAASSTASMTFICQGT